MEIRRIGFRRLYRALFRPALLLMLAVALLTLPAPPAKATLVETPGIKEFSLNRENGMVTLTIEAPLLLEVDGAYYSFEFCGVSPYDLALYYSVSARLDENNLSYSFYLPNSLTTKLLLDFYYGNYAVQLVTDALTNDITNPLTITASPAGGELEVGGRYIFKAVCQEGVPTVAVEPAARVRAVRETTDSTGHSLEVEYEMLSAGPLSITFTSPAALGIMGPQSKTLNYDVRLPIPPKVNFSTPILSWNAVTAAFTMDQTAGTQYVTGQVGSLYEEGVAAPVQTVAASNGNVAFSGLTWGKTYKIGVRCFNGDRYGEESFTTSFTPIADPALTLTVPAPLFAGKDVTVSLTAWPVVTGSPLTLTADDPTV